jgi:hypothetical protein
MSSDRFTFDAHAFCALPLVRRVQAALVVGLAVFLLTLVVLHEPFRGYLAEVHIAGPAIEGLDLDEAVAWLKHADRQAAVIATPAGEISPKSQIRVTYVARLPGPAIHHVDDLADRLLYQYLPDRLQAYRRAALAALRSEATAAREREDSARNRIELLRQRQLTELQREPVSKFAAAGSGQPPAFIVTTAAPADDRAAPREKLEAMRMELSRLAASFTDAHPQVITLRSQIAGLERQLGIAPGELPPPAARGPELIPPSSETRPSSLDAPLGQARNAGHYVAVAGGPAGDTRNSDPASLSAAINGAVSDLARASRDRQLAEHRLNERMHELSNQPTAAQWSEGQARVVTRLGGTPRSSVLAFGMLLAGVAGAIIFRAAGAAITATRIQTPAALASALELPVVGNTSALRGAVARLGGRILTPIVVRGILFASEAVVVVAVAACLLAIAVEPSLARQVVADPFGTLSEVMGRFGV